MTVTTASLGIDVAPIQTPEPLIVERLDNPAIGLSRPIMVKPYFVFEPVLTLWRPNVNVSTNVDKLLVADAGSILQVNEPGEFYIRVYCSLLARRSLKVFTLEDLETTAGSELNVKIWTSIVGNGLGGPSLAYTATTTTSPVSYVKVVSIGARNDPVTEELIFSGDTTKTLSKGYSNPIVGGVFISEFRDVSGNIIAPPKPVPGNRGVLYSPIPAYGAIICRYSPQYYIYKVTYDLPNSVSEGAQFRTLQRIWLAGIKAQTPIPGVRVLATHDFGASITTYPREIHPAGPDTYSTLMSGGEGSRGKAFQEVSRAVVEETLEDPNNPGTSIIVERWLEGQFITDSGETLTLRFNNANTEVP